MSNEPEQTGGELQRPGLSVRRLYMMSLIFAVLALAALAIDLPIASFFLADDDHLPGDLKKVITQSETFAHGYGAAVILVAAFVLDPVNRRSLIRICGCAFLPGALNMIPKWIVGRGRPYYFRDRLGELPDNVWETFIGFLAGANPGKFRAVDDSELQSFASGHTAAAVGLAIGLTWLYPRGRWLFGFLACMAALQRIESGAHFLSDTLAAAALASLVAALCLDRRLLGRLFDHWERVPG